ncbi:MAG: MFS transporter [Opitutaceae bacterium]|nr:MFS transporter [Opitutaceae bacterium]
MHTTPPPSPPSPPPPGQPGPKTWRAGTLVYTGPALAVLFFWLCFGDFSWAMRDRSVGPMAQWYLNNIGVSKIVFGLLLSSFPTLLGIIIGPVISVKSDRYRGRLGRRIPFLLITTPLGATGVIGLGLTPVVAKWIHGYFPDASATLVGLVCFSLFWAFFEVATIAGGAVFGGLINDVVPKQLLGRFHSLFRAISLIDGILFSTFIFGHVSTHFTVILCTIGVFYGVAFTWVCVKVKEGAYPPPPPPVKGARNDGPGKLLNSFGETKRYFRECFTNPYYLMLFVLLKISVLSFGPINTFALPYAKSLGISDTTYGRGLGLTYTISLTLAFFLGWAADVFHPLRMALGSLACYIVVTAFGYFFATTPAMFLIAWVAHGVLSGCYFTSAASLGQRLFPHSRYAQFASAAGLFTALANMIMAPLIGLMIDTTGNVFRYTFAVSCVLAILAVVAGLVVHQKFMKLGGPKGYIAPE